MRILIPVMLMIISLSFAAGCQEELSKRRTLTMAQFLDEQLIRELSR